MTVNNFKIISWGYNELVKKKSFVSVHRLSKYIVHMFSIFCMPIHKIAYICFKHDKASNILHVRKSLFHNEL